MNLSEKPPSRNVSGFLDYHLQPIIKQGETYIRDTGDLLAKFEASEEFLKGAILVTPDVVGFYPSTPHSEGLDILKRQYEKYLNKKVSTEDIEKMAHFVLKNNLFELILNFIKKYQEQLLEQSLALRMLVFLWTTLKRNFS